MEVKNHQEAPHSLREQLDHYKELCKRGRHLDALEAAEKDHGPLAAWQQTELRTLAVKALGQLGQRRAADAIIFRTWRRDRRDHLITPYYLQAFLGRQGPLKAWEEYQRLEDAGFADGVDRAYLLCINSDILSAYRDFDHADRCLREAREIEDSAWLTLRRAQLLHESDQHSAALALCAQLHREEPGYIAAAQTYASLLQRDNQSQTAFDLLAPYWESSQSLLLGRQFCQLAIELKHFEIASRCLARMEQLLVRGCPAYLRREQDNLWADYHCAQGEYDAALPYLEQKGFYQNRISEAIRQRGDDSQRKILPLPFIQQRHMTCAPASIATVLQYWGASADQDSIAEAICYNGTSNYDQRAWLRDQGWHQVEFDLNIAQLRQLIDREIPVLLSTVEPGSGHLQVIAGYDRAMGTYILRDPSYPRLQEMLVEESERYYAASGPRCTALVPAHRAAELDEMNLRAAALYDHAFRLREALEKHQFSAAVATARQMRQEAPQHRLTVHGLLDIAYYSQDDRRILQYTEQLLQQYPDDVNLQLGKVQTLSRLNASDKSLDFLESLEKEGSAHFLIRSRLADTLRFDHRNQARVDKLLAQLLRLSPLHAPTLYAQAGHLWDKGEYANACTLYRFVTCLEETNETYASSYFKAARFLKQTDAALAFLRDRFKRFGGKSSGPAISLFHALDALELTEEGLEILKTGIEQRPQDGDLMLFSARRQLYLNRVREATELTNRAKGCANRNRHLAVAAEICTHRQQRDKAIALWQKILQAEPLNYDACNSVVRLLIEQDLYPKAIDFLDRKLREFPGNYQLQRMRLNWLAEEDVEQTEQCCLQLIESHPDDNWAFTKLAYLNLQRSRPDDALHYAQEATRISRTDTGAWVQLGHVHLSRQNTNAAREAFKQAISLSCDCTAAFAPLLQCAYGLQQKKTLLAFIHGELMRQVSFGDGILCYQSTAAEWLPGTELLDFLHKALQQRPDLWHCWLALAFGFRDQGSLRQAQATLLTALKRFPLLPRLHLELAEILRLRGDLPAASQRLDHALKLNPDWADLYNKRADLLEAQGKYEEAISTLEGAIRRIPNDSIPRGYLADLLWRREQSERAIETVSKCIELSPFYGWAWYKLFQWSQQMGSVERARQRLAETRSKFPNSAMLARVDAEFSEEPQQKLAVLAEFAKQQPQNVDIACRYIEALSECGEFMRAQQVCSADYWQGEVPVDIQTRRAWLAKQQGDMDGAIAQIEEITRSAPYFYEAWRLLAIWALDRNRNDLARDALDKCRSLQPNDASVLTFVAEGLQRLSQDSNKKASDEIQREILSLLERAFELEPSDQYNGLTYLDLLIERKDWPRAREVLDLIELHNRDAFVLTRELQILHAEEADGEVLLGTWEEVLVHPQSNDWTVQTCWNLLAGGTHEQDAAARIEALRQRESGEQGEQAQVHPYAGYCLARHQLKRGSLRKFEKQFARLPQADAFTQRALGCYLDRLARYNEKPTKGFVRKLETLVAPDTNNWGTYGMLLTRQTQWFKAKQWFANWQQRENLRGWMLYFASLSYRQCGDYPTGARVMAAAFQLPHDNYRGDIVCCHTLDLMLADKPDAYQQLQYANLEQLDPVGRYALSLCRVLATLGEGGFVEEYRELAPKLRDAQYYFQKTGNAEAAQQTKRRVHKRLKATIRLNGLKKLFWIWRLSNHF